jgi:hypothetical protein
LAAAIEKISPENPRMDLLFSCALMHDSIAQMTVYLKQLTFVKEMDQFWKTLDKSTNVHDPAWTREEKIRLTDSILITSNGFFVTSRKDLEPGQKQTDSMKTLIDLSLGEHVTVCAPNNVAVDGRLCLKTYDPSDKTGHVHDQIVMLQCKYSAKDKDTEVSELDLFEWIHRLEQLESAFSRKQGVPAADGGKTEGLETSSLDQRVTFLVFTNRSLSSGAKMIVEVG